MNPIEFKEQNKVYAENQEQYLPLPVYEMESIVITSQHDHGCH